MILRLKQFIEYLNISYRKFEVSIGASYGVITKAISQNSDIQTKWIAAIAENYRQLNIDWLLTGAGQMLSDGGPAPAKTALAEPSVVYPHYNIKPQMVAEPIAQYNAAAPASESHLLGEIRFLKEQIQIKDRLLEGQSHQIEVLHNMLEEQIKKTSSAESKRPAARMGARD